MSEGKDKTVSEAHKRVWQRVPIVPSMELESLDDEQGMRRTLHTTLGPIYLAEPAHLWTPGKHERLHVLVVSESGIRGTHRIRCGVYERMQTMQDLEQSGAVEVARKVEGLKVHPDEIAVLLWDGTDAPPRWHRSIKWQETKKQ